MAYTNFVKSINAKTPTFFGRLGVPFYKTTSSQKYKLDSSKKLNNKGEPVGTKKKVSKKKHKEVVPKPKFSFRRNVLPPLLGVLIMIGVFGLLNSEYIIAQYTLHYAKPISVGLPAVGEPISMNASEIVIPSINAKAPIINEPSFIDKTVQKQLQNGVVHYGNLGEFGKNGNVVIIGHSSGAAWTPGDYKYIFTFLNKLKLGDKIMVDYHGQRYIYSVTSSRIVAPTNIDVLKQPSDKKTLTLITCSPIGSNSKRLVVVGEQISPKPITSDITQTQVQPVTTNTNTIPGSPNKSLLELIKSVFSN